MTSKKIAATLGTGTLGAGAAGAAALNMGSGSEKSLELDSSVPVQIQEVAQSVTSEEPPSASEAETGKQPSAPKTYFDNATDYDKKAVDSNNWRTEKATSDEEITIKIDDGGDSWQCTIKGIVYGGKDKNKSQIEAQVKQFVEKIKGDETKKNNFVENCAKARISKEKSAGKVSTIELELEESGGNLKLKDLENLLEKGFSGLKRIEGDYQSVLGNTEAGLTMDAKKDESGKALITLETPSPNKKILCSIYGELVGTGFKENGSNFDYLTLNGIFWTDSVKGQESEEEKNANQEKRNFLIRNCAQNNGKIEGVRVVQDSSTGNWKIENLEEKLLTKIYRNPEKTKSQQEQKVPNASGPGG